MHSNPKIILVNFGWKNVSFEKVMAFHKTTAQPC